MEKLQIDEKTKVEVNLVNSMPAMYCNRIYLGLLEDGMVRLSFCEEQRDTGDISPRASILLSDESLLKLKYIIEQIIDHKNTLVEQNNKLPESLQ